MAAAFVGGAPRVFGELPKAVEEVTTKAVEFKRLLNRLKLTLNQIIPIIKDIEKLNRILNRPNIETEMFTDKLKEGKRLVLKCAEVRWWNLYAKPLYAKRLIAFDNSLVWFFQIDVMAQISRYSQKTMLAKMVCHDEEIRGVFDRRFGRGRIGLIIPWGC